MQSPLREIVDTRRYWLESGEAVTITIKEFQPIHEGHHRHAAVSSPTIVFLPGWAMGADSEALERLGAAFARSSGTSAISMSTEIDTIADGQEALYKEAQAIALFIKERGLNKVILVGHSQGGDRGIDLATILQDDSEISLKGLALIDAVGLYDQEPGELARHFAEDSLMDTASTVVKKLRENPALAAQGMRVGASIVAGIFRDWMHYGSEAVPRVEKEVAAMAKKNPHMSQVAVPIVFITGTHDPVVNLDRLLSANEEERMVEEWEKTHTDTPDTPNARTLEVVLKRLFPKSPYVRAIIAEKLGHHGLPLFRPESVASITLFILKQYEHSQKGTKG